jgi:hypothetical protein
VQVVIGQAKATTIEPIRDIIDLGHHRNATATRLKTGRLPQTVSSAWLSACRPGRSRLVMEGGPQH